MIHYFKFLNYKFILFVFLMNCWSFFGILIVWLVLIFKLQLGLFIVEDVQAFCSLEGAVDRGVGDIVFGRRMLRWFSFAVFLVDLCVGSRHREHVVLTIMINRGLHSNPRMWLTLWTRVAAHFDGRNAVEEVVDSHELMVSAHPVFAEASASTPTLEIVVDAVTVSRRGICLCNF